MNLKLFLFIYFFFISQAFMNGQAVDIRLPEAAPEAVGLSAERLALIDAHIEKYIKEGSLPGGVFMIARRGKLIYNQSFGMRDSIKAYQEDDIFRLASMTKAFTAVSIMQLYEKGQLGLDDPIHYYIPEFKDMMVAEDINQADSSYTKRPAKNKITIRHLLTHSSGITYGAFQRGAIQAMYDEHGANGFGLSHESIGTLDMARILAKVPLIFEPGTEYSYGLNMEILGAIIEVISGRTLSEYFREHIFEPLNLQHTDFYLQPDLHERVVPVYTFGADRKLAIINSSAFDYPLSDDRTNFAGGGGMSGSAGDYMVFIQALLNGGEFDGERILSRKTIEVMTADQIAHLNKNGKGFSSREGISFCLGFALITEEGKGWNSKSPGTYEWSGYFNTRYFIDPEEDLIFVGMTQVVPFGRGDFWDRLEAIIYGAITD